MGASHRDATLLAHLQRADLQQHRLGAPHLPQPQSPPRKLQRASSNDSATVHVAPPSPNRRVQSQHASGGALKRPHGALRLPPRSAGKQGDGATALGAGASTNQDDATEVYHVLSKRDKGKGRADDQDEASVPRFRLEERAVTRMPRMKPLVAIVASPTVTKSSSNTTRRRVRAQTTRRVANAAVATPSTPAESAEALSSSLAAASSASVAASIASVTSSIGADLSRSAASRIASRASILNSISPSLLPSVQTQFSQASSIISSRRAAASASTAGTMPTSISQTSAQPTAGSTRPSSSGGSTSSRPTASVAPGASSSNPNRLRDIVVPSVVIPVALVLLGLFLFCCQRKRHRAAKNRQPMAQHSNISNPMLLGSNYGTAAGAGAGAAALTAHGGRRDGPGASAESFATTPSAIGVAFSEPRTKWGRRSLSDVVAAGAVGAGSAAAAGKGRGQVISASSSFGGGRQPSITNLSEVSDGTRPYSPYRPGMPRPLMNPPGTQHYDPFAVPPSIVPVAARGSSTAWAAASSSGSDSAYGSDNGRDSDEPRQVGGSGSHLPPAVPHPVPYSSDRPQHSRADTQATQTSGEDVFYTDQASSAEEEELEEEELTAMQRPVDFGSSGSSGSEGLPRAGGDGTPRPGRASASPSSSSTPSDRAGTPRLGAGHGSMGGVRKGDGSWW